MELFYSWNNRRPVFYSLNLFLWMFLIQFIFIFQNRLEAQVSCCNILTNGSFESGNSEFTSGLPQNCMCTAGSYCIGLNFQSKCSGWPNLSDHTGGGNFLIIDGHPSSPVDVWTKSTQIVAGTSYCLSFWVASVYSDPFSLGLAVNGILVPGATFNVQQNVPGWTQYTFNWIAAVPGGTSISIRQLTGGAVRDFGLDDIEFGSPISAGFNFQVNPICGLSVNFTNTSVGPSPITYLWNFDDPGSGSSNTSTLLNPFHMFSDCGVYNVCLTITRGSCTETICKKVIANDLIPPKAICQNIGLVLDDSCKALVTPSLIDGGSSDNCGIKFMTVNPSIVSGCGISQVSLIVEDFCGNKSSCIADVQTIETVPPIIVCPPNKTFSAYPPDCTLKVDSIKWVAVSDNCSIPTVSYQISGATQTFGIKDASGVVFNQGVSTVTYIATDACGNTASCSFTITINCGCCPLGSIQGPNMISNPDFSAGISGFNSDYSILNPICTPGLYNVESSIPVSGMCVNWNCVDHTTNSITGKMFVADGSQTIGLAAWRHPVSLAPNTNYSFCAYVNNLNEPILDRDDPIVEVYLVPQTGPAILLATRTLPESPDQWEFISGNYFTPALVSNPYNLEFRTASTSYEGNNFAIDDISFNACLKMDSCACGPFEFFYSIGRGPLLPKNCGDTLTVPDQSYPIGFLSSFQCLGLNCPQTTIDWQLTGPTGFNTISQNGVVASPNFTIPISNATFNYPGLYTLTIIGHCGQNRCPCTIYFYKPDCSCEGNLVLNPGFYEGAIPGDLGFTGNSNNWNVASGSPQVAFSDFWCDEVSIQLWGKLDACESICQPFAFQNGHAYSVDFFAKFVNLTTFNNVQFEFIAAIGCIDPITNSNWVSMGITPPISSTSWASFSLPVWTAPLNQTFDHLIIRATSNQIAETPFGRIDNICIKDVTVPCDSIDHAKDLVAHYPLDNLINASAQSVPDLSTNNINGIGGDLAPTNAALLGGHFNGTSTFVDCGPNTRGITDKVSLCAFVKTTENQNGMWVAGQYNVANDHGYSLQIGDRQNNFIGFPAFAGRDGTGVYHSSGFNTNGPQINDGKWHCLVGIAGNNTWSIYVDGILVSSQSGTTNNPISTSSINEPFTIGYHATTTPLWYNGEMGDIRLYNRVLTECEIDSFCLINFLTSSKDVVKSESFQIYPNPNSGIFTVKLNDSHTLHSKLRILDMTGRVLHTQLLSENSSTERIELEHLDDGVYLIQLISKGKIVACEKFIKH
ncbi:MAG: T9SS type A sorting domain-containing protein [Saprospiraceae bacterium]|nr:T9SS type A sorting domain-containing protein [Saprospiraceae bacterium]MBK8296758.1 T9SS type A sorting domain-containing protein [Saprospiraceae bacterium]